MGLLRVSPTPWSTASLQKGGNRTDMHTVGAPSVATATGQQQDKDCQEPPDSGWVKEGFCLTAPTGNVALPASQASSPQNYATIKFCCSAHVVPTVLLWRLLKLIWNTYCVHRARLCRERIVNAFVLLCVSMLTQCYFHIQMKMFRWVEPMRAIW